MSDAPASTAESPKQQRQRAQEPLPPPTALKGREDRPTEDRPTDEVLATLATDGRVSQTEASSALEWFLSEEPEEDVEQTHEIELNVGVGNVEHWIKWIVRPIDSDELRRIQRQTATLRRRGRQDDLAVDTLGNIKVIIAGSVEPDIQAIADQKGKTPESIVQKRFERKPGLVAQLASQIMALSGFDDEDVRDALSAKN